jgi:uncharacterized membrane protein YGL010W
MRSVQTWLEEYGESHRNPVNKTIHWICVPLILLSVIGLLWGVPRPAVFASAGPYANWATLALLAAVIYYLALSVRLAAGMLVISIVLCVLAQALQSLPWPLWATSLAVFVGAWIGQFIGHEIEGKKPSFFKDLQFLLIGPLWLLAAAYRKLQISY